MKTNNHNHDTSQSAHNQLSYFPDVNGCEIFYCKPAREKEYKEYNPFGFTAEQLAEFKKQDEKEERAELRRLRLIKKYGPGKNIHLHLCGEKWGIKSEGNSRFLKIYKTKTEAWRNGLIIARDRHAELFEHRRTGRVLVWNTYPCVKRDTLR